MKKLFQPPSVVAPNTWSKTLKNNQIALFFLPFLFLPTFWFSFLSRDFIWFLFITCIWISVKFFFFLWSLMLGGSGLGSQTLHASQAGSIPRSWFQTGGKATNFVSYSGACARPVGGSSQACPALSTSVCQKTAKIAGYNQGKRGGARSPPPASVKVLQSESGDWGSSDSTFLKPKHILFWRQLAFFPPASPCSPPSLMHTLFSGRRFHLFYAGERRLSALH